MEQFEKVNLLNKQSLIKIKLKNTQWSIILSNKDILFEAITDLLLDKVNLFFYTTQKTTTKTLKESKQFVNDLYVKGLLDEELKTVFTSIGWDKDTLNINSSIFQGDLGEYLSVILIDKLNISSTLISKVSLKTSPKMPSYGNDNIYFDYEKNILYFGESKFHEKLSEGFSSAIRSLNKHKTDEIEISFISNHTGSFIAENSKKLSYVEKKFNVVSSQSVDIGIISFIIMDDKYSKEDIESLLKDYYSKGKIKDSDIINSYIIALPIISKQEFLKYFKKRISGL